MMFYMTQNRYICKEDYRGQEIYEYEFKCELLEQVSFYMKDDEICYRMELNGKIKGTMDLFSYLDEMLGRIQNAIETQDIWGLDEIDIAVLNKMKEEME